MFVPEIDKKLCAYVAAVWVSSINQGYTVGTVCQKQFVYKKKQVSPSGRMSVPEKYKSLAKIIAEIDKEHYQR
jgi:hypothetical protein